MAGGRIEQGTPAWFDMVGTVVRDAAERAGLPADQNVSLVECYTDGVDFGDGPVQGTRFDIVGGRPSFRVGARPGERGDITVEVTSVAVRESNRMHGDAAGTARERYIATGELRQDGDPSRLGAWFEATHEPIVDRTR